MLPPDLGGKNSTEEVAGAAGETVIVERNGALHAALVGAGILLSRLAGLIRQSVFNYYFGLSDAADAFTAGPANSKFSSESVRRRRALGVVHPRLCARLSGGARRGGSGSRGRRHHAAILALTTSLLALVGAVAAPYLIDAIAPGFHGDKRELTIHLCAHSCFPAWACWCMSAWCLGILNSHRRFFLSYTAPVRFGTRR